ncbi:MAG: hemerythrin domain-containing protein [Planctomycetes bacterium]|nr:hemerythrin domain-containing protein [Planctomycetota bacterium]
MLDILAPLEPDPIDVLLGEHRTILQVLDEVERESRRLEAAGALREVFWRDLLRFVDEFDAGLHHRKEEALLFPALERAGLASDSGPTAVLRDEHRRIQFWRDRLERAVVGRDRLRVTSSVASFIDLVRNHVLKENQILFPLARRLLGGTEIASLSRAFVPLLARQDIGHWIRHPFALEAST